MDKNPLLVRQLKRIGLNETQPPSAADWQNFLTSVNRTYTEADQERYLTERSMEISLREMSELNSRLQDAQHIAKIGYFIRDIKTNRVTWSKEFYHLLNIEPTRQLHFEEVVNVIHPDDRLRFLLIVQESINTMKDYEIELRLRRSDGEYGWFLVIGHLHPDNENNLQYISGIVKDITKQKMADIAINELNQQLLDTARKAGMAEVATSILHNVGNILNSINVSIGMTQESLQRSRFDKLNSIVQMLKDHQDDLANFLTHDKKGQLIPEYLGKATMSLTEEFKIITREVESLNLNIKHIKEIVAMQQDLSGVSGVIDQISMVELLNDAIDMSGIINLNNPIVIQKTYEKMPLIITDKARVMQIIINLLRNAQEAMTQNAGIKRITISLKKHHDVNFIAVCIKDNGAGIPTENLTRIFSFGFTTKQTGNGFGLHSSALIANALGGTLKAESKGSRQGASFTLILPIDVKAIRRELHEQVL